MQVYRDYYMPPRDPSIDEMLRAAFRAYRAGDRRAADPIARHLLPVMMREAGLIFKNRHEDTEDAAQEAMRKLLAAVPGMETDVQSPRAFARKIARNVSLNVIRSQLRIVTIEEILENAEKLWGRPDLTPEEELVLREECAELQRALGALSGRCRRLIHDRFALDKKLRELHADYKYRSPQAVHKKLERCLTMLRKVINQGRLPRLGKVVKR
jgi:RNA polymerase sigma factor (sigma-70 family)